MNLQVNNYITQITVITLNERIDAASAPALRHRLEQLLDEGVRHFVLDLADVPFMDSAGMAVMVSLLKRARMGNGDVKLVSPKLDAARRILQLTKFDRVFDMMESAETAVKSF